MTIEKQAATLRSFLEAAKKATPGPWHRKGEFSVLRRRKMRGVPFDELIVSTGGFHSNVEDAEKLYHRQMGTADFISLAPEAAAAIVAVLRECITYLEWAAYTTNTVQPGDYINQPAELLAAIKPIIESAEKEDGA